MSLSFIYPEALYLLLTLPLVVGLALLGSRRSSRARYWCSVALRVLILLVLVLALAGMQIVRRVDELTVVFVLDFSDSVPQEEQERAADFIRQAVGEMRQGDKAAIVVFGENALVERLASEDRALEELASIPVTRRTNIAQALQLALALFPEDSQKRIVLLSDGQENVGKAMELAELAAAREVGLAYVPLSAPHGVAEVLLERLEAPTDAREGQSIKLTAVVRSTIRSGARLQVFGDGQLIYSEEVRLEEGSNRFVTQVQAGEPGFRRFRAQIMPDYDTRLQNNVAAAFTVVAGPPRVLLVEGIPGEAANLDAALTAAHIVVEIGAPHAMPATLEELSNYEAVVLVNAAAKSLPEGAMKALQAYVRDLGKGLVMVGGEQGYGAGGYLRTPLEETLPVDMDVRSRTQEPNLALVVAVDKSGSMGRCHCDNPYAQPGSYERVESGLPKVDIAKEAIMRASEVLGPLDYLGVVAFDQAARWAVETQQLLDPGAIEEAIGSIRAEGQTNIFAGLSQAEDSLVKTDARIKHIILMTDGWSSHGEYGELARRLEQQDITLSVVAAGRGSAVYLRELAERGGGRFYPAVSIRDVPDIFLKETITTVGSYIIEERFRPLPTAFSPILDGLDTANLPPLLGYNGTTAKATARVVLLSARGDPVLATWQYGLGRAVAWTCDATGRWAVEWVDWDGFARFAAQLVGWVLPTPQDERLSTEVELEGSEAVLSVESLDDEGRPRSFMDTTATLIGPDFERQEVELRQVAAGQYRGSVEVPDPGTYLIHVMQRAEDGRPVTGQTSGLVVPYSPEYGVLEGDSGVLSELAGVTGGVALIDPADAFARPLAPVERAQEVSPALLLAAALLFPLDVGLRRVMLSLADLQRAVGWVRMRLPRVGLAQREPVLGRLFQARDRSREAMKRGKRRPGVQIPPLSSAESSDELHPPEPAVEKRPPAPASPEEALARLREAKERARRRK
jgi:Mg-chelatase subunit ChlD